MSGGTPVRGVQVNFTVTKSNGQVATLSATTGSDGSATVKYRIGKKDPSGTYQDTAATQVNGRPGSATTNFMVKGYVIRTVASTSQEASLDSSRGQLFNKKSKLAGLLVDDR